MRRIVIFIMRSAWARRVTAGRDGVWIWESAPCYHHAALLMVRAIAAVALSLLSTTVTNAYWLMNGDFITTERIDPIVNPGAVSGHTHAVVGGSNFGFEVSTDLLTKSQCTSVPIKEDKSNYWFPLMYFQWANGSFSSVSGGVVIYYLFPDKAGSTTAFPPDFRMISGNPKKRTCDPNSFASQAIDFLCLDFNGKTTKHQSLPDKPCPSGIRSQVNFPSCWNGKDIDSPDHKSHVAFRSGGPDKGECTDPNFPVSIPRIFLEVYWGTGDWNKLASQAKNPSQPFVFSYGDRTGCGNHADFYNGWEPGVLQRAVDKCHCDIYGSPQCCAAQGIFTYDNNLKCKISRQLDEITTGTLPALPGNNPVQEGPGDAIMMTSNVIPAKLAPAYVYSGNQPTKVGTVVVPATTIGSGGAPPSPSSSRPVVSSSSVSASPVSSLAVAPISSPPVAPISSAAPVPSAPVQPVSSAAGSPSSSGGYVAPSSTQQQQQPPAASSAKPSSSSPIVLVPLVPSGTTSPTSSSSPPPAGVKPSLGAPPAAITSGPPSNTSPAAGGTASPVKTYISSIKVKPTGTCPKEHHALKPHPPKKGTNHRNHNHNHRRQTLKRRYDFDVDDYYSLH